MGPVLVGPVRTVPPAQAGANLRIGVPARRRGVSASHPVLVTSRWRGVDPLVGLRDRQALLGPHLIGVVVDADRLGERCHRPEQPGELGRDDELGGPPVTDALERLEILDDQHVVVRRGLLDPGEPRPRCRALAVADLLKPQPLGAGAQFDRLRVTLGVEDRGLPAALGGQDRRLLLAVGASDGRLLEPAGFSDRGPPIPLGPHLGVHRRYHFGRRVDALDLDAHDADAPLVGGVVEDLSELEC